MSVHVCASQLQVHIMLRFNFLSFSVIHINLNLVKHSTVLYLCHAHIHEYHYCGKTLNCKGIIKEITIYSYCPKREKYSVHVTLGVLLAPQNSQLYNNLRAVYAKTGAAAANDPIYKQTSCMLQVKSVFRLNPFPA